MKERLAEFRETLYDPDEIAFTHDVVLERIVLIPERQRGLYIPKWGAPGLLLAEEYPLQQAQEIEVALVIGEAGLVEDQRPAFRFAAVRLGSGPAVYGEVHPLLELCPKC